MNLLRRALLGLCLLLSPVANAGQLIELFTSHGCHSCPPADALLHELQQANPDLVTIEWHVDYWDTLVVGGSNWVDPFSDPEWSKRQRDYNRAGLDGRPGVYTPQAVVDGVVGLVGSDSRALKQALGHRDQTVAMRVQSTEHSYTVQLTDHPHIATQLFVVWVDSETITRIQGGENDGRTLRNHNVVRAVETLTPTAEATHVQFDSRREGRCAVILQQQLPQGMPGRVLDAVWCPAS